MGFSLGGALGGGLLGGPFGAQLGGFGNSLFGMKQYDATSNSSSTRSPWAPLAPQLEYSINQARSIYDQGVNPFITQGSQMLAQRALDPNSLTAQAQSGLGDTISGKFLTPDSNPYFQSYMKDALGQAGQAFAGQYGGFAGQNLNNTGYQESLARALGQIATNAYSNAYGQERQNQIAAQQAAPALDYANANALYQAGQQQQLAPWTNLLAFQSAFGPALNFGTTTGTNTQPLFENRTAETLGALLGGGALLMGKSSPVGPKFGGADVGGYAPGSPY